MACIGIHAWKRKFNSWFFIGSIELGFASSGWKTLLKISFWKILIWQLCLDFLAEVYISFVSLCHRKHTEMHKIRRFSLTRTLSYFVLIQITSLIRNVEITAIMTCFGEPKWMAIGLQLINHFNHSSYLVFYKFSL